MVIMSEFRMGQDTVDRTTTIGMMNPSLWIIWYESYCIWFRICLQHHLWGSVKVRFGINGFLQPMIFILLCLGNWSFWPYSKMNFLRLFFGIISLNSFSMLMPKEKFSHKKLENLNMWHEGSFIESERIRDSSFVERTIVKSVRNGWCLGEIRITTVKE